MQELKKRITIARGILNTEVDILNTEPDQLNTEPQSLTQELPSVIREQIEKLGIRENDPNKIKDVIYEL